MRYKYQATLSIIAIFLTIEPGLADPIEFGPILSEFGSAEDAARNIRSELADRKSEVATNIERASIASGRVSELAPTNGASTSFNLFTTVLNAIGLYQNRVAEVAAAVSGGLTIDDVLDSTTRAELQNAISGLDTSEVSSLLDSFRAFANDNQLTNAIQDISQVSVPDSSVLFLLPIVDNATRNSAAANRNDLSAFKTLIEDVKQEIDESKARLDDIRNALGSGSSLASQILFALNDVFSDIGCGTSPLAPQCLLFQPLFLTYEGQADSLMGFANLAGNISAQLLTLGAQLDSQGILQSISDADAVYTTALNSPPAQSSVTVSNSFSGFGSSVSTEGADFSISGSEFSVLGGSLTDEFDVGELIYTNKEGDAPLSFLLESVLTRTTTIGSQQFVATTTASTPIKLDLTLNADIEVITIPDPPFFEIVVTPKSPEDAADRISFPTLAGLGAAVFENSTERFKLKGSINSPFSISNVVLSSDPLGGGFIFDPNKPTAVTEPGTLALFGIGLLGFGLARRKTYKLN